MKRGFIISLFLIVFLISFISAQENNTADEKIDKAYQCLEDKVKDKCSSLTLEEQIFTVLSIGKCSEELISNSKNNGECWPKSSCNVKSTAQAVLALDEAGKDTGKAEQWLFSQNRTPADLIWYLEIEVPDSASSCKISYSDRDYIIQINEDKTLSSGAGSCLDLAAGNYWLKVAPSCYSREFTISCDKGFLTTLLYQKQNSDTEIENKNTTTLE
ncbi:MAG: hypothetical protein AABY22_28215, partial [Nanoarchaeota archaeon]